MRLYVLLSLIFLIPCILPLPQWTTQLVQDYFSMRSVNILNILTCSGRDTVYLMKTTVRQFWFRTSPNITWDINREGVFIDADCEKNVNILLEAWFHSSHSWLVWSTLPWSDVVDAMTDNLRYNSDVVLATPDNDDNTSTVVRLRYLQHSAEGVPMQVSYTGVWNLSSRVVKPPAHRNIDLQGATLNGSVVINQLNTSDDEELRSTLLDDTERRIEIMAKLNYGLWHILEKKYNFSTQLKRTDTYGYEMKNGSFDGIIGVLSRGEAELGISSVRALTKRGEHAEFVGATWVFRSSMLFLHPKVQGVRSVLIQPFSSTLWAVITLTALLVAVILKITSRFEVTSTHKAEDAEDSWAFSFIVTISALCDQGSEVVLRWLTWRIAFFSFLVLAELLNSYYSAAVVSFLLQPPAKTIRTVKDLTKSNLKVGMTTISYNMDFFKVNKIPAIDELFHKKIFPSLQSVPNQYDTMVAFKKLKEEHYAIHTESITMYAEMENTFTEQQRCALTEIDLFPSKMTFAMVRKRSQYTDIFKQGLKEHGILHYETLKWRPQRPQCTQQEELNSVDIEAVSLAFIILTGGTTLSLVLLSVEIIQQKWKNKEKNLHYLVKN